MKQWIRRGLMSLCLLLCLAVLLVCSSDSNLGRWTYYLPETVEFNGQDIEVDSTLERSALEEDSFSQDEDGTLSYSGEALYGIDLSAHQGEVDWAAVAESGVDFAMLRAGYRGYGSGQIAEDSQFANNLTGAQEAGLQVGVYFFSQAITVEEAQEEAAFVLELLDGQPLDLPIAYDWEYITYDDARTDSLDAETVTACAAAFCAVIESAGYDAMVYCNGELGYLNYDLSQLQDYEVWYAEYADSPSFAYAIAMWQYSSSGTVSGIDGEVDLDIWFLSEESEAEEK
ncbi:MAG: glycoside hydrolase family 25 protein [Clostridiales bacterium]|nr:glycoside hydrolase family 25 protein [Clostridiales bacterium]